MTSGTDSGEIDPQAESDPTIAMIEPAWFGLADAERDERLAAIGYRIRRQRKLRDGTWLFDLEAL